MKMTFQVIVDNGGDAEVTIEVSKKEYNMIMKSEEEYLSDDEDLEEVFERADEAFRDQQSEFDDIDIDDYDYKILIPEHE